jgi:hypothetical protein
MGVGSAIYKHSGSSCNGRSTEPPAAAGAGLVPCRGTNLVPRTERAGRLRTVVARRDAQRCSAAGFWDQSGGRMARGSPGGLGCRRSLRPAWCARTCRPATRRLTLERCDHRSTRPVRPAARHGPASCSGQWGQYRAGADDPALGCGWESRKRLVGFADFARVTAIDALVGGARRSDCGLCASS